MKLSLPPFLAVLAATSTASAQVTPIVTETFEYASPGLFHAQTGGMGWSNAWFVSGGANDDLVVTDNAASPAFSLSDGVGGHGAQAVTYGAAYRQLDLNLHPDLIDSDTGMWGRDDTTIWVSFTSVAFQGTAVEHYGGLSLWKAAQATPEALFLGSPWNEAAWGFDDEGGNGAPGMVLAGSDDSAEARLVYRIDFQPGDERIRFWVNPAVAYPTTPADIDATVVDLRFDEIRLSAGGNNGDLFFFDAIELAKGTVTGSVGSNYCTPNANSTGASGSMSATGTPIATSNQLTLRASNLPNASFGFFITSQTQGFVMNPAGSEGNLCLGGAIGRYVGTGEIKNTMNTGAFSLGLDLTATPQPTGFVAVLAGQTWNFQAWHRETAGGMTTSNFTDGLRIAFQ